MSDKLYLYPLWVRVWHAINGLLCFVLIYTGYCMQYAGGESIIMLEFEKAISLHNICGILLLINYLFFLIFNLKTGNKRHYKVKLKGGLKNMYLQISYYNKGFLKGEEAPFQTTTRQKFNPLQKFTYVSVMYILMPLLLVSGISLFFPITLMEKLPGVSSLHLTSLIHRVSSFSLTAFLIIHIYSSTLGHSPSMHFKSIITGWSKH